MELRHLRYFVVVAEELSFTRAAQKLFIAQPPLSQQIRKLESELGVTLFDRTKRTVSLTRAGEAFLEETRRVLEQVERAVTTTRRVGRGEIGQLNVGFTGPALNSVLPRVLGAFRHHYPEVNLELHELRTVEQVEALTEGHLHVGLLNPPVEVDTLVLEILHREGLVVVLPETHKLASGMPGPIPLRALSGEPLILFPRRIGPKLFDEIIGMFRGASLDPNVVQEIVPQQTILALVALGFGITLLPSSVENVGRRGLIFRALVEPTPEVEVAVAWRAGATHPALRSFLQVVRSVTF